MATTPATAMTIHLKTPAGLQRANDGCIGRVQLTWDACPDCSRYLNGRCEYSAVDDRRLEGDHITCTAWERKP